MIYSLFNKFQGAWLGSVIATARFRASYQSNSQPNPWEQIATIGTQSLIQQGYLDLNHWQAQIAAANPELLKLVGTATVSEAVWATLPVSLFYHEHYTTTKLLSAINLWLAPEESPHLGLAMGEAIALLLDQDFHEKFPRSFNQDFNQGFNQGSQHNNQHNNLISQPLPIAFQQLLSRTFKISPSFWENLPCLESAIKVINSQTPASQAPFAIACYCLLSTPEDFVLSIDRAAATPQPEIAIALTGFLSGAYNTRRGIPLSWQEQLNINSGIESGINYRELVDRLFATWSGVYHHSQDSSQGNFQYSQDSSQDSSLETLPENQQWQIAKSPIKPLIKIPSKFLSKNRKKS